MTDRLAELHKVRSLFDSQNASNIIRSNPVPSLKEPLLTRRNEPEANEFMAKIDIGQEKLEDLIINNEAVGQLIQMYRTKTLATEADKIAKEVDKIVKENEEHYSVLNTVIADIKNMLSAEDNELSDMPPLEKAAFESSPEYRMKRSVYGAFVGKFQEVLKETNSVQGEFRNEVKKNIKGQLKVANPRMTEEELEAQVANPEEGQRLLSQQVLGVHENVKSAIRDIEAKYREIIALERSVEQVHQMFLTLSGLVQEQSEMLNNIENNMVEAKNYITKGEKHVVQARKWYQETRTVLVFC